MLTREECVKTAESLAHGNTIDRRNATRSLTDYCRVILGEIGSKHPDYLFITKSPIDKIEKLKPNRS